MDKAIVLDFASGELNIFPIEANLQIEDVEKVLTKEHEYRLGDIQFMVVKELKMRVE